MTNKQKKDTTRAFWQSDKKIKERFDFETKRESNATKQKKGRG